MKRYQCGREATRWLLRRFCLHGGAKHFQILCEALDVKEYPHFSKCLKDTNPDDKEVCVAAQAAEKDMKQRFKFDAVRLDFKNVDNFITEYYHLETENERLQKINVQLNEELEHAKGMKPGVKSYILDCVDSSQNGNVNDWLKLRSLVDSSSFTEQIARLLGSDIVQYMTCHDNPPPAPNKYAECMRKMVDKILSKHQEVFDQFVEDLEIDEVNGLQSLWNIADHFFFKTDESKSTVWEHIATLYAFGGHLAQQNPSENLRLAYFIGDFLGYYVSKRLAKQIDKQGGWVSLITLGLHCCLVRFCALVLKSLLLVLFHVCLAPWKSKGVQIFPESLIIHSA